MMEFLNMGGYAGYVWSSYALAMLVLLANLLMARQRHKSALRRLRRLHEAENPDEFPRQTGNSGESLRQTDSPDESLRQADSPDQSLRQARSPARDPESLRRTGNTARDHES